MGRNQRELLSLSKAYEDLFLIGAAVNHYTIDSELSLLEKHFNSLTAENEMKFEHIQPKENQFQFEYVDKLVSYSERYGHQLRGHTLVWHNQTSDWIFKAPEGKEMNRDLLLERMKSHIMTLLKRYKGKFYSWDVVNEAISDQKGEFLRSSPWLDIIGEDFIDYAFRYAHEADPEAALFYNDYNECDPEKRDKIYTLVKDMLEKDVPIHGIGLQAHWNIHDPSMDHIRAAIEKYASLGLQLQITEMDVSMFQFEDKRMDLLKPTNEMLEKQAERYEQFFKLFKEYHQHITSVTFWGVSDKYTWLHDFPVRGRRNWPFLFDENNQTKEAYWRVIDQVSISK
ncbi:endo-1,4-beta-xylanase [Alkalihalobacillus trypoxylicola]|uniref:Beta-xylanase n=1 Tax=Alkalihalobacillus trypoxylicola TaxID=519424 RepID=A0A162FC23_9BACI|nr:endo-1,4-beta-xylanase [Alkalihalobacillus trypoxylicola]KYG35254.1 1,4-beta-xylanase [Alkalihalobacillus trypoxylicola]